MFAKYFNRKARYHILPPAQFNNSLIHLNQVVKTFFTPAGTFTALKGITMQAKAGEFVSVVGKSGSGKSTLINLIAGIDRLTSGEIFIGDTPLHDLKEGEVAVWRGRMIGIVFQFFQLLPGLTAIENVMLAMDYGQIFPKEERPERAIRLLEQVEMDSYRHTLPARLSGGQQQRVAIARALANDPPILVADEPTGNLDSKSAENVFSMFDRLASQGKTILMVTHDPDLAKRTARTLVIADGVIVNDIMRERKPQQRELL